MTFQSSVLNQSGLYNNILQWFYTNSEDAIVLIWDKNDEIIYLSNKMEEFISGNVSDLIGGQWIDLFPPEHVFKIKKHMETSEEQLQISNIVFQKGDSEYSFNSIIDTIYTDDEQYFLCRFQNKTYINDIKKVLLDSEKLILAGQLSAGLVHEIRNPLTSLKGFLQLVQAGVEQKEEYYKVMIGEIDKLEKITSELLQMAKPFKYNRNYEDVHEMIKDVLFLMDTQVDMRDMNFNTNIEEDLVCFCNASQIKQVLINLIKNGAEAMDKKGTININIRKENNNVAIDIIDKGQGMSEEVVRELSNPFFTTKSDGTGLGLVITHHILDMHNGRLEVSSDIDNGAVFTVLLPIDRVQ